MRIEDFSLVILFVLVVAFLVFSPSSFSDGLTANVVHDQYSSFSSVASRFDNVSTVFSDDIIYDTVYYSVNGSSWQSLSLSGDQYLDSDSWLSSSASFSLPSSLSGSGEHYLLLYSCSLLDGSWDCHGRTAQEIGFWQLFVINNSVPLSEPLVVENCSDGIQNQDEEGIDCGGGICSSCSDFFYVVSTGEPLADIVVSSQAPPLVSLAAQYFQEHIADMSGATLPIGSSPNPAFDFHVYIGQSSYTDALGVTSDGCEYGGYKMLSGDDYLVLLGDDKEFERKGPRTYAEWDALTAPDRWNNDFIDYGSRRYNGVYDVWQMDARGSMNAVYAFLEAQGLRLYYPSQSGIIIPEKTTIRSPHLNKQVNPDFPMRYLWFYGLNFLNLQSYHFPDGEYDTQLQWQFSLGINDILEHIGFPYAHGIGAILLRGETVTDNPEYYALYEGVYQTPDVSDYPNPNLCYPYITSENTLFEENIRFVKTMFDVYNLSVISVMPTDGFDRISDECAELESMDRGYSGSLSDYVWEYVNNLAWEIYEDPAYADKKIICTAYTTYTLPPTNLSRPIAPNLDVQFSWDRTRFGNTAVRDKLWNNMIDWRTLLATNNHLTNGVETNDVYVYSFYLNNKPEQPTQPFPAFLPQTIAEDMRFLQGKSQGELIEIFDQHQATMSSSYDYLTWDPFVANAFNSYITAKLYWDANLDVDALLEEYYTLYYGPARDEMKLYVEYTEENYPLALSNPTILKTMRQLANDALAVAELDSDPVYAYRIEELLKMINSTYLADELTIDDCQILTSPGSTYRLSADVTSAGSCFRFDGDGITLDCQGHTITYGTSGSATAHGIVVDEYQTGRGDYFTLRNCIIQDGDFSSSYDDRYGVYLHYADNGIMDDVYINTSASGIYALNAFENNFSSVQIYSENGYGYTGQIGGNNVFEDAFIATRQRAAVTFSEHTNNSFYNNTFSSQQGQGMAMDSTCSNFYFLNNMLSSISSAGLNLNGYDAVLEGNVITSVSGRALTSAYDGNNMFIGNVFSSESNEAVHLESPRNTFMSNVATSASSLAIRVQDTEMKFINQSAQGGTYGFALYGATNTLVANCSDISGGTNDAYIHFYPGARNNTFLNCSYDAESVSYDAGELFRSWYLDVLVTDALSPLQGVVVNVYDQSDVLVSSINTDASGLARHTIVQYLNTGDVESYTPHRIEVISSGYQTATHTQSLTDNVFIPIELITST